MSIEKRTADLTTLADRVNAEHRACEEAVGAALGHAINAGELLTEAKEGVAHGSWGAWLAENFEGSERTAQAYMKVYRRRDEIRNGAADLSLRGALKELEAKSTEKPATKFYSQEWVPHESGQGHRVGRTFYTMEEYARAYGHGLLPPLQDSEYAGLEKSLIREGCRSAIVAWNNIILDGHARYEICVKHGVDYLVRDVEMDGRTSAMVYIIDIQLGRKNLGPLEKAYVRTKYEVSRLAVEHGISEEQAWEKLMEKDAWEKFMEGEED
ncbi:MAG: DUF3102 domain-containing protein [Actinomycetota bacterium]|nr:DUF3102 domain-containing protein [Actinomycetota bacterium]